MADYKNIFKPYVMKNGVTLKNRVMYSNGQQTFSAAPGTGPDELMMNDLAIFARAGAALMNWGHFGSMGGGAAPRPIPVMDQEQIRAIRRSGRRVVEEMKYQKMGSAAAYNYNDDKTWNMLGQVAEAAHLYDTRVVVKLGASFPRGKCLNGIEEPDERLLFPLPTGDEDQRFTICDDSKTNFMYKVWYGIVSPGEKAPTEEELKAKIATREEIEDAIDDIVDMCMRYKNVGFDGMSLRGDRWGLNASTNIREDEYNGEIEARGLFQYQVFKRIKEVCGDDFIVEVVMPGASDHGHDGQLPHGYTEEEFIRFMKFVEPYVDIVEVREPLGIGYQCMGYNSELHTHKSADIARHLREAGFEKCIAVNGGYHDPDEMEQIISEGVIDMISTVRSFRAEPEFMNKLHSKGTEIPTPCLRCNKCHGTYEGINICSVNPKDALNHRLPIIVKDASVSKKVAIIGGGLIGMRTACFAAERGHRVTIFEKDSQLGGKAGYYAPKYKQCWPINRYLEWLKGEVQRRGISDIRLGCEPTVDQLKEEGFDAIIACTGSREQLPPVSGADAPGVWKNEDVYMGRVEPGNKVVIVGGGTVSTETAMYLASLGKDVTVVTRQEILMRKQFFAHGPHMSFDVVAEDRGYGRDAPCWVRYNNLKPVYHAQTKFVSPTSVTYEKDGREVTIEADTVIVSGGYEGLMDEALGYTDAAEEFYLAGDVRYDCDNLAEGNRSAYGRAVML